MSEQAENTNEEPQQTPIFGITTETKATNAAPILVAEKLEKPTNMWKSGWKFPIAKLVNVVFKEDFDTKNGKTNVIQLVFKDMDGRQYTHTEWEIESGDANYDKKYNGLNERIKHIYTAVFGDFPKAGIGTKAKTFKEYLKLIAGAFNSRVYDKEGKTVKEYSKHSVFIKLVYYKKNFGFPLSPNFVERVPENKICKLLTINETFDQLVPTKTKTSGGIPGVSSGSEEMPDDLATFDEEFD